MLSLRCGVELNDVVMYRAFPTTKTSEPRFTGDVEVLYNNVRLATRQRVINRDNGDYDGWKR